MLKLGVKDKYNIKHLTLQSKLIYKSTKIHKKQLIAVSNLLYNIKIPTHYIKNQTIT